MTPIGSTSGQHVVNPHERRNISERAIGESYHKIVSLPSPMLPARERAGSDLIEAHQARYAAEIKNLPPLPPPSVYEVDCAVEIWRVTCAMEISTTVSWQGVLQVEAYFKEDAVAEALRQVEASDAYLDASAPRGSHRSSVCRGAWLAGPEKAFVLEPSPLASLPCETELAEVGA
jgi:hypothetical protein